MFLKQMAKVISCFLILFLINNDIYAQNTVEKDSLEDGPHRTYFAGGALFVGQKNNPASPTFSQVLIRAFSEILPAGEFRYLRAPILRLGMGVFTLNRGLTIIDKPMKHRIVGKTIKEIIKNYQEASIEKNNTPGTINIIGSSYGTVVGSQVALYLLDHLGKTTYRGFYLHPDTKITLTLSASAVDHESPVYTKLLSYLCRDNVNFVLNDISNNSDPMVGAVGSCKLERKNNIKALLKLFFKRGPGAVLGYHLKGMKDVSRVDELIKLVLIDNYGHGELAAIEAQKFIDENKTAVIAKTIEKTNIGINSKILEKHNYGIKN